ncbi:hypothetical protein [Winogradskyella sp. 3972H.M.0a.05]|uniref:hypothetical protein n=1 Tax=Winogradskyella sp. 3972H.M.0a.05 TaxID=2950277 RepID=UPI003394F5FB
MKNQRNALVLFLCIGLIFSFSSCKKEVHQLEQSSITHDSILSPKLLNSERIALKFGTYAVKVLKQDSTTRVSNLYSFHDKNKITRTFAVVAYATTIDSMFLKEHQKILEGQSIGRVFKKAQWGIKKKNLYFGEIAPSKDYEQVYKLMGDITPTTLAVYTYDFLIEKDNKSYNYATITEIYHPEYLKLSDLKKINPDAERHLEKTDTILDLLKHVENEMKINHY